jgi:hypothetical protein
MGTLYCARGLTLGVHDLADNFTARKRNTFQTAQYSSGALLRNETECLTVAMLSESADNNKIHELILVPLTF